MNRFPSITSLVSVPLILLALCCALIAALIVLPARWLMIALPDNAMISIADASGTVWRGRAQLALGPDGARHMLPQPVNWQWDNGALEVFHPWLRGPVRIQPGWSGLTVSAQNLRAPASVLTAFGAPLNTISPGGQISLEWQSFIVGHLPQSGNVAVGRWTQASSALSHVRPLGDYRLHVTAKDGIAQFKLSTDSGALTITGQGQWHKNRIRLQGIAEPADNVSDAQRAALTGLLSALGPVTKGHSRFGTPQ